MRRNVIELKGWLVISSLCNYWVNHEGLASVHGVKETSTGARPEMEVMDTSWRRQLRVGAVEKATR